MGKRNIKISDDTQNSSPRLKSYSVDEIMAAGGTTAFAEKMGKSWQSLVAHLEKLPKDAFLTDEEVDEAIKTLNETK